MWCKRLAPKRNMQPSHKESLAQRNKTRVHTAGCSTAKDTLAIMPLPPRDWGWQLSFGDKKLACGDKRVLAPCRARRLSDRAGGAQGQGHGAILILLDSEASV